MKVSKKIRFLFSLTSLLVCLIWGSVFAYADTMIVSETESVTSEEDTKTFADGKITLGTAKSMVEQYAATISQISAYSYEEQEYLGKYYAAQTDLFENFAKTAGEEGCGNYVSYDNVKVEETEAKNQVDVTAVIHFEKKDLKMIMHVKCFDNMGPQATSIEFTLADEGEESIGDKMATAGANTLMGMGTVFVVLIFISCIISLFGFIPKLLNQKHGKEESSVSGNDNDSVPEIKSKNNNIKEDDAELIAVIAAAIAASEQTSTDSFVVRSIRRR